MPYYYFLCGTESENNTDNFHSSKSSRQPWRNSICFVSCRVSGHLKYMVSSSVACFIYIVKEPKIIFITKIIFLFRVLQKRKEKKMNEQDREIFIIFCHQHNLFSSSLYKTITKNWLSFLRGSVNSFETSFIFCKTSGLKFLKAAHSLCIFHLENKSWDTLLIIIIAQAWLREN